MTTNLDLVTKMLWDLEIPYKMEHVGGWFHYPTLFGRDSYLVISDATGDYSLHLFKGDDETILAENIQDINEIVILAADFANQLGIL